MKRLSYFVYYRVAPTAGSALRARVGGMLDSLAVSTGMRGRLLVSRDDPLLWMEIYEGVADGPAFEAAMNAATKAFDIDACVAPGAQRHIECFTTLPDEAPGSS